MHRDLQLQTIHIKRDKESARCEQGLGEGKGDEGTCIWKQASRNGCMQLTGKTH